MKRILSIVLAMVMLMVIPLSTSAREVTDFSGWESSMDAVSEALPSMPGALDRVDLSALFGATTYAVGDNPCYETEPNDTMYNANHIVHDDTVIGSLPLEDVYDSYIFTVSQESEVILVAGSDVATLIMGLFDEDGTLLYESLDMGYQDDVWIDTMYVVLPAGTYYAVVTETDGIETNYILYMDITPHTHTYTDENDTTCDVCGAPKDTGSGEHPDDGVFPFTEWEWEVLRLTNLERAKYGLEPLTAFATLQYACDIRAQELTDLFDHIRPDGRSCFSVFDDIGLAYGYAGENIASGYRSPAQVVNGWMNSEGHRANILDSNFVHLGVGERNFNWVQMFTGGGSYRSVAVNVPADYTVEPGTSIEEMGLVAILESETYGTCYLPVASSYCIGYDPNRGGAQTVTISVLGVSSTFPITVYTENTDNTSVPMFRMYDPNSGEHFYTGAELEREFLVEAGWQYEGVGFNFPEEGDPVYRLYEPVSGEHLYTMDEAEMNDLLDQGWQYEGVAFNSAGTDEVPQYRLHNPNAKRGGYHFTGSEMERDILIEAGWIYQGIGWYSCLE